MANQGYYYYTKDEIKYIESSNQSVSLGAGATALTNLSSLVTIPSGYTVVSATIYITGSGSTSDAWTKMMGVGGNLDQANYAVCIKNTSSSSRTFSYKVGVLCVKLS